MTQLKTNSPQRNRRYNDRTTKLDLLMMGVVLLHMAVLATIVYLLNSMGGVEATWPGIIAVLWLLFGMNSSTRWLFQNTALGRRAWGWSGMPSPRKETNE